MSLKLQRSSLTRAVTAALLLILLLPGCSRPRSVESEESAVSKNVSEQKDQLLVLVEDFSAGACHETPLTPACRSKLATLAGANDERGLAIVIARAAEACAGQPDDGACEAVINALVGSASTASVLALLGIEEPGPQQTVLRISLDTLEQHLQHFCEEDRRPTTCSQLAELMAGAGSEPATRQLNLLDLHRKVSDAALEPMADQVRSLRGRLSKGPDAVPELLDLLQQNALDSVERELIIKLIINYGVAARPFLLAAVKEGPLPVGLSAAYAGWDPAADEREDPSRVEGPKRSVQLDDAADHIGKNLVIHHKDGTVREGRLIRIDGDTLYVETRIGGGTITTSITRSDVERIQF